MWRGPRRRGRGGLDAYALLLAAQLAQRIAALDHKPPATLTIMAACVAAFLSDSLPLPHELLPLARTVPPLWAGCLQPATVLQHGDWSRVLWSPFLHADEFHLIYNMSSLLWKGVQLESRLGSRRFAALSAELLLLSQAATLGLSAAAAAASPRGWGRRLHTSHCAVGLSGLLFSYKVLLTWRQPGASTLWGMQLPTRHLAWAELVLSSVLNPRASFLGHLGGILAGLLHVTVIAPAAPVMAAAARRGVLRLRLALRPGAARFATTTAPSPRRTADSTSNQQRRRAPHQARGAAAPHDEPTTPAPVAGAPHAPALSADELRARRLQRFG